MATKVVDADGAVIANWAIGNSDAVKMGSLTGGALVVQIAVNTERLQGSNDGVNWDTLATAAAANDVIQVVGVPLFIRARAAADAVPTGTVIAVGWQDR